MAAALGVGLVALLGGGDDDGPTTANPPGPTTSGPPVDSSAARAAAHALALRVVMTPEDWGAGYTRGDPYERDPAGEYEVGKDCQGFDQAARSGTLAAISRTVRNDRSALDSTTEVRVFSDPATAKAFVDGAEDTTRRCTTQRYAKTRWSSIHQATEPEVVGLEQVMAEEGTQTAAADGGRTDFPYVLYTGRKGDTVVSVLAYETRAGVAALRPRAGGVLQKLQRRLEDARASAGP
ncbi:hypothetical protein ACIRQF_17665 [Streptomyces sp. NPDC101191]|uniref:hypothetical protein n=1 Tax=Streptomyces sp. NPDC101191 TaxID=3366126 RepID=UPI0037FF6D16